MIEIKINPYRIIRHTLNYIVIALLVLNSGSAIMTVQKYADHSIVALAITGVLCIFVRLLYKKRFSIKRDNVFNAFAVLLLINLASLTFNFYRNSIGPFLKPILILFVALIFVNCYSCEEFTYYFTRTIKILCVIAIFAYALYCVIQIPCELPTLENYNGAIYRNGYLFVLMENYGIVFKRAMSIFWEPGLLATMIYFSFMMEVFLQGGSIKFRTIALYLITISCTLSVAALLMLPFAAMLFIKQKLSPKGAIAFMTIILLSMALLINQDVLLRTLAMINPRFETELFSGDNMSFFARMLSPFNNLKIFLTNPLVGVGYGEANAMYNSMHTISQTSSSTYYMAALGAYNSMQTISQTSSSTYYMAALGAGGIMYTVYWIVAFVKIKNISKWAKFGGVMLVLLLLNKEPHFGILVTCCILFYLIDMANEKRGTTNVKSK